MRTGICIQQDPLEYREGAQYLFPPDCGVQHFPDDNHATCASISRTLPLVFGKWRGAERVLRELREPSLSGAVPEAVQRVLRFADTPNTWGTVLMLRYVELEDQGIIIAKRGMSWHTWYKDYYREYPRRVVGPEVVACVREMIDELGFSVEPEVEGFTPERLGEALAALSFLYKIVLGKPLDSLGPLIHARRPQRLPVVLTCAEVAAVLGQLRGTYGLMVGLLYGGGLRLSECVKLRVKDVDLNGRQLNVRQGKRSKDRVTLLPHTFVEPLRLHLETVALQHRRDIVAGAGYVELPHA